MLEMFHTRKIPSLAPSEEPPTKSIQKKLLNFFIFYWHDRRSSSSGWATTCRGTAWGIPPFSLNLVLSPALKLYLDDHWLYYCTQSQAKAIITITSGVYTKLCDKMARSINLLSSLVSLDKMDVCVVKVSMK